MRRRPRSRGSLARSDIDAARCTLWAIWKPHLASPKARSGAEPVLVLEAEDQHALFAALAFLGVGGCVRELEGGVEARCYSGLRIVLEKLELLGSDLNLSLLSSCLFIFRYSSIAVFRVIFNIQVKILPRF